MSETIGDLMQFAKDCNEETVLNMPREKLEVYVLKLSTLANALHTNVYKATMAATCASAMALHSEINNRVPSNVWTCKKCGAKKLRANLHSNH